MLQTLSDYASHRLTAHGDDEAARHAHAVWVRDLARSVEFGAKTSGADRSPRPRRGRRRPRRRQLGARGRSASGTGDLLDARAVLVRHDASVDWMGAPRPGPRGRGRYRSRRSARRLSTGPSSSARCNTTSTPPIASLRKPRPSPPRRMTPNGSAGSASLGHSRPATGERRRRRQLGRRGTSELRAGRRRVALGHVRLANGAADLLGDDLDGAVARLVHGIRRVPRRAGPPRTDRGSQSPRRGGVADRDIDLFAEIHAELLELGRSSRSTGVVTGATARLALASLCRATSTRPTRSPTRR